MSKSPIRKIPLLLLLLLILIVALFSYISLLNFPSLIPTSVLINENVGENENAERRKFPLYYNYFKEDDFRCKKINDTHVKCLPNVLFIGSSKAGTTSLVDFLSRIPQVKFMERASSSYKHYKNSRVINASSTGSNFHREIHRFDRSDYIYSFKYLQLLSEIKSSPFIPIKNKNLPLIHYTPHYFYAPTVPYDVKQFFPNPNELKFIIMLRNPVERALSSYWFKNSQLFHNGVDT
eukprot:gene15685-21220_t